MEGRSPAERQKRRREFGLVLTLAFLLVVLTAIEYKLFGMSQHLPFEHSIFFLGLVNFNIILFLLLFFLIFRNVVKIFAERPGGLAGGSLRAKLIAAFVAFSFVPTALMFIVSVFYINNSFDKWFSEKTQGVLKSAMEVTEQYLVSAKSKNYHFATRVAEELAAAPNQPLAKRLAAAREHFALDVVEYYPSLLGRREVSVTPDQTIPEIPPLNLEMLERGIRETNDSSTQHQLAFGDLIRVIHPVKRRPGGAVVVSTFIPQSVTAKIEDISTAYVNFRNVSPLEYPVKSIYLIILVLMTLTIMLGATWFGFYLAQQLSVPLVELGAAAQRVANREYQPVRLTSGSREINQLVRHFNQMTRDLETSEREVSEANANLRQTLGRLDEHSRYINVVLSTVSTGVVSLDADNRVSVINRHAAKLLDTSPAGVVGRAIAELLDPRHVTVLESMINQLRLHKTETVQRELQIQVGDRNIPLQMTVSLLTDEAGVEIGKLLVFDDLTAVLNAQRAAAWTEVARRIAHEIKNPLTPIKLSAERLQKKFGKDIKDEAFGECTRSIIEQVDSLKNLVNEFNQFARLPKSHPRRGDLNRVIEGGLVLFRTAGRADVIDFQADANVPPFDFDPDQVQRIINNLVDNALAATLGTRPVRVSVRTAFDEDLMIARIEVEDDGPGIPAGLKARVFEPYVTTKEHGTGLGLALVKRMVEDHQGYIRVFSDGRTHSRFVIELPVRTA